MRKYVLVGLICLILVATYAFFRSSTQLNSEPPSRLKEIANSPPVAESFFPGTNNKSLPSDTSLLPAHENAKPGVVYESAIKDGVSQSLDEDPEDKIRDILRTNGTLQKIAAVNSVECRAGLCTVELEAKEEESDVQTPMLDFLQAHPEFGTHFQIVTSNENPRVTYFSFSKENLGKD